MRLHPFLVTATVLAAVMGCSKSDPGAAASGQSAPPTAAPACPPESPVKINSVSVPASGTTATIDVDPDPRPISRNAGGVRWTLQSPQGKTYEFTSDGITFKANAPAGPASSVAGKTEFVVCFGPTPPDQIWPYTIKFVDKDAPATVWVCDPTIVNRESLVQAPAPVAVNCTKQP